MKKLFCLLILICIFNFASAAESLFNSMINDNFESSREISPLIKGDENNLKPSTNPHAQAIKLSEKCFAKKFTENNFTSVPAKELFPPFNFFELKHSKGFVGFWHNGSLHTISIDCLIK